MCLSLKPWASANNYVGQKFDIEWIVDDYDGLRIYMNNIHNPKNNIVLDTRNCTVCTYRSLNDLFTRIEEQIYYKATDGESEKSTFFEVLDSSLVHDMQYWGLIGDHSAEDYLHLVVLAGNSIFELVTFKQPELRENANYCPPKYVSD